MVCAVTYAGDNRNPVRFDLHASTPAETLLAAPEFVIDGFCGNWYTGREACQGRDEAFAVGFARRFKAKHLNDLPC